MKDRVTARELVQRIEENVKALASLTDEVRKSDLFKSYLYSMSRFWRYSHYNQILIRISMPKATRVAGIMTWNTFGRRVMAGEHGIRILAPIFRKPDSMECGDDDVAEIRFITKSVFDITQTEGTPMPEMEIDIHGNDLEWLMKRLTAACAENGIPVEYADLGEHGNYGQATRDGITLNTHRGLNTQVNTLVHEMAHWLLHIHVKSKPTKVEREIEAEGVAYVVLLHFGVESLGFNYLAGYLADAKQILARLKAISAASRSIIGMLEPKDDAGVDPDQSQTNTAAKVGAM